MAIIRIAIFNFPVFTSFRNLWIPKSGRMLFNLLEPKTQLTQGAIQINSIYYFLYEWNSGLKLGQEEKMGSFK